MIKLTKIYMVRHCEALGNVMRLFQGSTDLDISDTGAEQLKYLTERFSNIKLDKVYSSPLIRAKKTAHAICDQMNLMPILSEGLRELNGGIVEGKPFKETFNSIPGLADAWDNHPQDFFPEGGEAMRDAYERIWETLKKIAVENQGKTVACATHGGVLRCLHCRLLKNDISELKNIPWAENTAVSLIEFDDNLNPTIVFFNDHSHLPEELIPKRNRLSSFMKGENK